MRSLERKVVILAALAVLLAAPPAWAQRVRMTGQVTDAESRRPIAGADVELANLAGGQGFFRARTDGEGRFTLEGIAPDRYYGLTVSAAGYADFVIAGWQFPAAQRAVEVAVPMERAGILAVTLRRATGGEPVIGAKVTIRSERGQEWWEGMRPPPAPVFTGRDGTARFPDLKAGYWTVVAEAPGLRAAEVRRVGVRRGETTAVPVRLVRPASLSGTVELADGTGVGGIAVTARGPSEGVGTSGPDGSFTVGDLEPGKYRLHVDHEGFQPSVSKESYALAEGEPRGGIRVRVTPRPAELAFVLNREAFVPGDRAKVGLRAFRLDAVELTVYAVPTAMLLDPRRDFRRLTAVTDTAGLMRVLAFTHETAAGPAWTWREEEVEMPQTLAPGAYVLRGRAGGLERRALFFVTDLGLLVKRSATRLLASAGALTSGRPVAEASVYLVPAPPPGSEPRVDEQGRPLPTWTGSLAGLGAPRATTDAQGLAVIDVAHTPQTVRVVAVSAANGVSVVDAPLAPAAEQGGDVAYLYTERPIYRPGQVVYWKTVARRAAGASGYALPDATLATLTLTGPGGYSLPVLDAAVSPHGTAHGAVELPSDAPLGDWSLAARVGGARSAASFAVQEYRKPEFQVTVTPDRGVYVSGDEVRFKVAAAYFFGAPVFGAALRYNLFESRLRHEGEWDEEEGFYGEESEGGFGRVLRTGETRTDADGRAELTFTLERVAYDRRLTLEVEVVDGAGRSVSGRGSAIMGRGLFTIELRPAAHLFNLGADIPVEVLTRDHTGKPVPAAVTLELDQQAWNPLERRYTRATRPLASAKVTTDERGRAHAVLSPAGARGGQMTVRATAEDSKGNRITAESTVWVYDERAAAYAYRYPALEAVADRDRYAPGDSIRVLVNTDARNALVLATLEGRELYEHRAVPLRGNSAVITFVARRELAPNAFVSVHVRKGQEVHSRTIEVAIEAARRDLAISLQPDREQYKPGDEGRIRVETRDPAGRPVPAEVSVGVVDEAIYSLRPDNTPDPHDVFYGRRPNWVTTAVAFPLLYYGGVDKGGRPDVRKDFRDVALWSPMVQTDASGRAEVRVHYPDNLTTWRITSRGATDSTLVGKAVARALVTKELVARLAVPRFLTAGDEATLVSTVTNRAKSAVTGVEQSIAAAGPLSLVGPTSSRADIAAGGEARAEWRVKAPAELPRDAVPPVEAALTFRARARSDADALEQRVPVRARAVPLFLRGGGLVDRERLEETIALPADLVRPGSQAALDLSPSLAGIAVSAARSLLECPYVSTEPAANTLRAWATLLPALRAAGALPPGWTNATVRLAPTVQRLVSMQRPEGGWGWWSEGEIDPDLTVLALDALARASAAGVANTDDALQRGASYVPRLLTEVRSLDGEAYALAQLTSLLALPEAARRFADLRTRLEELALATYSGRAQLGTAGLALAARGHAALGRAKEAAELLRLVRERGRRDAAGLHWPADPGLEDAWFGAEEENTAYALSALLALEPRSADAPEIVRWLAAQRTGTLWRTTRVTGPVTMALAEYLATRPQEARPRFHLRAEWNGDGVLDREVSPGDTLGGAEMHVVVPGKLLAAGANRLAITRSGTGSVYYAWDVRALVPSPGPALAGGPLQITREYLRAERTADRRGRPRYLTTAFAANEPLRVGEFVLVRLHLTAAQTLRWIAVEDPRVAGFEIDQLRPEGTEWPWDLHAEERDDRAAFFVERLEPGETVIEYLIRPEMAGSFTALPASASGVYDPELAGRSAEAKLQVVGR